MWAIASTVVYILLYIQMWRSSRRGGALLCLETLLSASLSTLSHTPLFRPSAKRFLDKHLAKIGSGGAGRPASSQGRLSLGASPLHLVSDGSMSTFKSEEVSEEPPRSEETGQRFFVLWCLAGIPLAPDKRVVEERNSH